MDCVFKLYWKSTAVNRARDKVYMQEMLSSWIAGGSGSDGSGAGDGVKEFWTETARQAKTQWWENLRLIWEE